MYFRLSETFVHVLVFRRTLFQASEDGSIFPSAEVTKKIEYILFFLTDGISSCKTFKESMLTISHGQ